MRLPTFTFDVKADVDFTNKFSDEAIADEAFGYSDYEPPLTADTIEWSPLDEFIDDDDWDDVKALLSGGVAGSSMVRVDDPDDITDERKAELNDRYNLDELVQPFNDAVVWAYERALSVDDDDIERMLGDVIEDLKGSEMYGILTDSYWCGVLAAWPWGDVCTNEEAVIAAVLDKAKVKGSTFKLTYAGTPYARKLLKIARDGGTWFDHDDQPPDPGFGGNSEMELGVIARYIVDATVERLVKQRGDSIERSGVDVRNEDLRSLFRDFFRTDQGATA